MTHEESSVLVPKTELPQTLGSDPSSPSKGQIEKKKSIVLRSLLSKQKCSLLLMLFCGFAMCTCFSITAPILPVEARRKDMPPAVMGIVFSSFALWVAICTPVLGNFISTIGAKFMLTSGQFVTGVCAILFGVLDKSPAGLTFSVLSLMVRSVQAVGAGAFFTASLTIIVSEFQDNAAAAAGLFQTVNGFGWMAGPFLGGLLFEFGGYPLPFWTLGAFILCLTLLTSVLVSPSTETNPDEKQQKSILHLLTNPLVVVACISLVFGQYCFGFTDCALGLHLDKTKPVYVGLLLTLVGAVYVLSVPVFGWLGDRKGVRVAYKLMIVTNIFLAISFALLGPAPFLSFLGSEMWLVIGSLVMMGLTVGGTIVGAVPCFYAAGRQLGIEKGLKLDGMVAGLFSSCSNFGVFLGATVGTAVVQELGFPWASTTTSGFLLFSVLCLSLYAMVENKCFKERDRCVC